MDRIRIFGATTVVVDGHEVHGPALGGAKPRQVLEVLALADGAPVTKDRLVEMLWEGAAPGSAVATLESYVCVLRRAIGGGRPGRDSVVQTTSAGYRLDTTRISTDLAACRALLATAASAAPADAIALVRAALELSDQPLLPAEARAAWADRERDVLAHQLVAACTSAARHAVAVGDVAAAVELSARATGLDPLDEAAVRVRMTALDAAGRRAEALRCYLALRARLVDELGVEPSAATRDTYVGLLVATDERRRSERPSRTEVTGLLDLLRDTLSRVPGLDTAPVDHALAGVATQALSLL
ncbi:AfsR/SARP family transcriptional regulator [Phycicoccus avicenniae]|uniref:AfsR/SARP family transcriptional regulator n=1 Tax=Phycicoccus avicenniae TaxID=2828860 RepID=UPI003D2A75D7